MHSYCRLADPVSDLSAFIVWRIDGVVTLDAVHDDGHSFLLMPLPHCGVHMAYETVHVLNLKKKSKIDVFSNKLLDLPYKSLTLTVA